MKKENKKTAVPALRFPEFREAGDWEGKSLENISPAIFDGTHQTPNYTAEGIPFFSVENLVSGNKNKFISKEDYLAATSKNKPEKGDILITRIGNIGFSAIIDWDFEFSIYVTLAVVKKSDQFDSNYLHCYFQSEKYQKEIRSKSLLNAVPCKINMDELRKTKILLPSPAEQKKLANFLTTLDTLHAAESEKLRALQAHKKGLMQVLFPAAAETVPRVRFGEFEGEWEEKTLGEVATFLKGKGISKSDIEADGVLPCIRYGELYTFYKETINEVKSYTNLSKNELVLSQSNDVIIPASGETKEDIATASCVMKSGIALGGDLNIIRTKINGVFLSYYLNNAKKQDIGQLAQGISVVHLYPSQLQTLKITIPKEKEQEKIATCLTALDALLTAQHEKLAALKRWKQGLMQRVFPNPNNEAQ